MPVFANAASRILSLALLTILLNRQGWFGLLVFLFPLFTLFYLHPQQGKQVILLVRRLRWFFLSIIILYFWFYPGTELIPLLGSFSPAIEGINEAVLRISSLLVVISYSVFLLQLTPREEIISGIQSILSPLAYLGIDSDRFALRLGLVLSMVPKMTHAKPLVSDRKKMSAAIDQAALMFKEAEDQINAVEFNEVVVDQVKRPGLLDILVPSVLFIWLLST